MIERGFSKPTQRVERLRKVIINATPEVEADRARLITESYKETEGMSNILRRAKACEKLFKNLPVTIREDELVVGSLTKTPRSTGLCPEFSYSWVADEFDTMATRSADPFLIREETKEELKEIFKYWKGKTNSEYADSLMSQEAKDCIENGIFSVGNYFYGGVGHVTVDYGKILKRGFRGVLEEVILAMRKLDDKDPETIEKMQFYKALIITYTAAIKFAHRYSEKARELADKENDIKRKEELLKISDICKKVPEYGADTFWEACQSFWFIQLMVQIESNGHSISPGRFDQYMYPYLKNDSIDRELAQELVDCIWVKFNDINKTRDEVSAQAFAGYSMFQNLCVGGQDIHGLDATNDVSYMCMESVSHVALPAPSFSVRVHQNSPYEFLLRACEVSRLGYGVPAFYNDEVIILNLVSRGVKLEDARDYSIIGCVEPQASHKTEGWHDAAFFNAAKVLEITLNNGRCNGKQLGPVTGEITEMTSIEQIIEAFEKQMAYFVKYLAEADNCVDYAHMQRGNLPFMSALVDDCIKRGKSSQSGGALYNFTGPQAFGVADSGDSLYAIEKNVFENKRISLEELKEALENNFGFTDSIMPGPCGGDSVSAKVGQLSEAEIYDAIKKILSNSDTTDVDEIAKKLELNNTENSSYQSACGCSANETGRFKTIQKILDNTGSFGNDDQGCDEFAIRVAQIYCDEVDKYTNPRGGAFQAGIYPVSANVLFGKDVGALPDGRLAGAPLADGVSPRQGKDANGPTAAANSVAKLPHFQASNGTLYNQKFSPKSVEGEKGLKNFVSIIKSYFDHKGAHIQFNVIDRQTLIDAQENPQDHKDLLVRVAGYSAHFVTLAKDVQDDIISRTEHTM
ncbi:formate C-acetyltransferase [Anaerococcus hydrogenalis DSM 7454]|uniref:Formate C-acetyltransferase n=1 Tax=Anaerococcus hydrogenalis DSM 7454 TaxID=561177 RepID=B6W8K7_9FIRM|nr:glycyl radical protein [Anaerococcus hydrogenalis]EEB36278.1 formate C-acetyltransferase [Anaerococcus hydrogenalis DSM 7454]